jgi:hypothetical protein
VDVEQSLEARSHYYCYSAKVVSSTYSEFVSVALVVTHANRTRCILLSSVASLVRPYFSILSHKGHIFYGRKLLKRECFNFFYNLCNISHFKTGSARYDKKCTRVIQ